MHPAPRPDCSSELNLAGQRAGYFIKLAAQVLPLFENEVRWARPHVFRAPRSRRQVSWHDWQTNDLGLQCRKCFRVAEG
eukprot:7054450-Pyramimonas_sp.AAC.1